MGQEDTPAGAGERERRLEEHFHRAAALEGAELEAFLEERRAEDPELAGRLESLLAEDERGTVGWLKRGLFRPQEEAEERVGRYRLVRVLGEGGMGTVHLAEQEEPVRRQVAIKTIRLGAHSDEVAARFREESQALALMNHPGIAEIYDGGVTEAGLPYFVMEYVPGPPLDEYCDRFRLDIHERLRLFARVCDAIQHAHQKGIVHRDLKPRNVLVVERDGQPYPKVIDFGIARAVSGPLARERGAITTGRAVGTYLYMSPEQADPEGREVDTRTDVYALGIVLYELLTGFLPYDRDLLARGGVVALVRAVIQGDQPSPSARVAALGEEAAAAASARRESVSSLFRRLAGDLDWIVARATEKDPRRRYSSASELAADIARHLADEPVEAGPPTTAYRAHKFVRRHRLSVGGATALVLSLVIGLVTTTKQLRRARRAEADARVQLTEARYQLEKNAAFVDFLFYGLTHADPVTGDELSVEAMFALTRPDIAELFRGRPGAAAAVRALLGTAYLYLGEDELAREELSAAHLYQSSQPELESHVDRFATLVGLVQATRRLEGLEAAAPYVRQTLRLAQQILHERRPENDAAVATIVLAAEGADVSAEVVLESLDELLALFPRELRRESEDAVIARLVFELAAALRLGGREGGQRAVARLERTAREILEPTDIRFLTFLWVLANLEVRAGDHAAAQRYAEELLVKSSRLPRGHWLPIDARRLLGLALAGQGDDAGAEAELLEAFDEAERRGATSPRLRAVQAGLAELAQDLLERADPAAAVAESWRRFAAEPRPGAIWWIVGHPDLPRAIVELAEAQLATRDADPLAQANRAVAFLRLGRSAEALAAVDGRGDAASLAVRVLALARLGRMGEAREVRAELPAPVHGVGDEHVPLTDALVREARAASR